MSVLKAHFDGKVLVPHEPVNLSVGCALELHVEPVPRGKASSVSSNERPLMKLAWSLKALPENPDWPTNGAAQRDH